jgi:alpha-glucosidase
LVGLRKTHAALRSGCFIALELRPPLLGFERADGSQRIRCLFNLSHRPQRCRVAAEGRLLFASGAIDQGKGVLGALSTCWLLL